MKANCRCHEKADKRAKIANLSAVCINKTNLTKLLNRLLETKAETFKLGMDQHARDVVVCVQLDGAVPLRPHSMTAPKCIVLVRGAGRGGSQSYSCYESGPCGYGLHRELRAAGAENYVVVPEVLGDGAQAKDRWAGRGRADRRARPLRARQPKAFSVVTVPTPAAGGATRGGAAAGAAQGHAPPVGGARPQPFALQRPPCHRPVVDGKTLGGTEPTLSAFLVQELEIMRQMILAARRAGEGAAQEPRGRSAEGSAQGGGALTWVLLAREICHWRGSRTAGRSPVTPGCVPGVDQSGGRKRDGSINRYGNPRVRALLIELVWRLARWQPDYPPVRALVAGIARGSGAPKMRGGRGAATRGRFVAAGHRPDHAGKTETHRAGGGARLSQADTTANIFLPPEMTFGVLSRTGRSLGQNTRSVDCAGFTPSPLLFQFA